MRPLMSGAPKPVQYAVSYPAMALAGYFALTYSGPYRWLAEWQLRQFGSFYEVMTWLGLSVLFILPPALIVTALYGQGRAPQSPLFDWIERGGRSLIPAVVGLGFVVFSGFERWSIASDPEMIEVGVDELEAGQVIDRAFVRLTGTLLEEHAVMATEDSRNDKLYVPVASEEHEPGEPVFAYLEISNPDHEKVDGIWGRVSRTGLPGHVRAAFEKSDAPPAPAVTVISYGEDAKSASKGANIMMAIGGVFFLITAPFAVRNVLRAK